MKQREVEIRFAFPFPTFTRTLLSFSLSDRVIPAQTSSSLATLFCLIRMKERSKKVNYAEVDSDVDLDEEEREVERMKQRQQQLVQVNKNKGTKAGDTFGATSEYTLNPTASNLKRMERWGFTQLFFNWQTDNNNSKKKKRKTQSSKSAGSKYNSKLLLDLPFDLFSEVSFDLNLSFPLNADSTHSIVAGLLSSRRKGSTSSSQSQQDYSKHLALERITLDLVSSSSKTRLPFARWFQRARLCFVRVLKDLSSESHRPALEKPHLRAWTELFFFFQMCSSGVSSQELTVFLRKRFCYKCYLVQWVAAYHLSLSIEQADSNEINPLEERFRRKVSRVLGLIYILLLSIALDSETVSS